MGAARTSLAGGEVILEVGVALCYAADSIEGGGAQGGSTQIRMDDDACRVDDALGTEAVEGLGAADDGGYEGLAGGSAVAVADGLTGVFDLVAHEVCDDLSGQRFGERLHLWRLQQALYAGQVAIGLRHA